MKRLATRKHYCVVCGSHDRLVVANGMDYQYHTVEMTFDWCRCTACGHFYIDPLPVEDALRDIYPDDLKNYEDFDSRPGIAFRVKGLLDGRRLKELAGDLPDGSRVLDVGCAAGMFLDLVKRHVPTVTVFDGLDISEAAAAGAKRKGYKVYVATIETAALPNDYYDLIYMQQVIEHVHNPRAVLKKLRASLRTGGRLVVETPNLYSWDHLLFFRGYWEGYHIPRHFNLWTVEGMRRLLRECGFSSTAYRRRIKPVHWTVSLQNWAIGTHKPNCVVDFFYLKNPLLLMLFGLVDVVQLVAFRRASDIQYVSIK